MLGTALIIFREVLEASLIIGIVLAASRGTPGRAIWVGGGVGTGVVMACVIAAFADVIAAAGAGIGQEVMNAGILLAAVVMLGWHNIWMRAHGQALAKKMDAVGRSVRTGDMPLYALSIVVGLATLREGAEVVLFLYGMGAAATPVTELATGGLAGLAMGIAVGALLYLGLSSIPLRHFFSVTGWLILLLAAGLASQAAAYLVQAGMLPAMGHRIWDTSSWLSEQSLAGELLHTLVGYVAQPAGIQVLFYVTTIVVIGGCMWLTGRAPRLAAARA